MHVPNNGEPRPRSPVINPNRLDRAWWPRQLRVTPRHLHGDSLWRNRVVLRTIVSATGASVFIQELTAEQARQQQVDLGFADPFEALSPAPGEDAPVWVVTLVEELILPAPGEEGTVQARSVVAIVDAESGQVLSAERREPEDQ